MTSHRSLAGVLTDALRLSLPPVAISFADRVPEGVKAFSGSVPAGGRFWQEATTKVFATVSSDHELCSIGMYTHRLEGSPRQQTDLQDALKVFGDLGYVREQDLPLIPVLDRAPNGRDAASARRGAPVRPGGADGLRGGAAGV